MRQQTIDQLRQMNLYGFIHAFEEQTNSTQYLSLSFEERLSYLVEREFMKREERKLTKTLKAASLKQQASLEDIDFETQRGLDRSRVMELAQCTWITKGHNLIITGPTGAGKSFLACALSDRACRRRLPARYYKTGELVHALLCAHAEGTYSKFVMRLQKLSLLIIDEWLRDPLSQAHAREILDVLDDRYRKGSTIFVSQLPVSDWHAHIEDPTLADAILDRVVHDSHRIDLKGDSMRKKTARLE